MSFGSWNGMSGMEFLAIVWYWLCAACRLLKSKSAAERARRHISTGNRAADVRPVRTGSLGGAVGRLEWSEIRIALHRWLSPPLVPSLAARALAQVATRIADPARVLDRSW
ncbi:hypothetical protein [Anatilimnocola aggregata]|uniref:hypothetical protein n=1 Tax=Anatilimnocola aggregata TaxID=2528021 RepID=UPI0011A0A2F7|nr:hypothetical protein [Anatilimnocola aggregata]